MGCGASAKTDDKSGGGTKSADGKSAGGTSKNDASKASAADIKKDNVSQGGLKHSGYIIDNPGKINEFYNIDKKKLGEGSYGSVSMASNKTTKAVRAVKSIAKSQMKNLDRFWQEIAIMKIMDHPNIVKLFESFEDHRNIYLVLELCTGGELFDRIIESGHFTEPQAATVMQHMFRAIYYMHENHICHRDLKPENFLFTTKDPIEQTHLKVIDFGLAIKFTDGQVLKTKAGTPYYVAPQVLSGKYDQSSDLWSLGVIMYVLLCGYPPFHGENDNDVLAKVRLGAVNFTPADWKNVSDDAKQLIKYLLKMNTKDRYNAQQALEHPWVKNKAPQSKNVPIGGGLVDNLKGFRSQNKLKKAALHVIAGQMGEQQIKALRDVFTQLDKNGDGLLNSAEMKEGFLKGGLKDIPADLQQILEEVDSDGSGVIDYTEFLAATLDKKVYMQENVCWQAFRIFDRNGDGKIDKHEIQNVLNSDDVKDVANREMGDILKDIDKNGDGEIDFDEFMVMMRGGGESELDAGKKK